MHATAFALGIHEDTGSLTYTSTTYSRRRGARRPACGWARTRSCSARYLRGPLQPEQRNLLRVLSREPDRSSEVAGLRVVSAVGRGRRVRRGRLDARLARRGGLGLGRAAPVGRDGGTRAARRAKPDAARSPSTRRSRHSGAAVTRRPRPASCVRPAPPRCSSGRSPRSGGWPARRCAPAR